MKYSVLSLKNTAPVIWLIMAIALFITGIMLIFNIKLAWIAIELIVAGLVFVIGVMYIISLMIKTTENKLKHLLIGLLCTLGGAALFIAPQIVKGAFSFTAGILGIIIGLFILLNSIKLKHDGASWAGTLMSALIYIFLGIEMAFFSRQDRLFSILLGFYLLLFAFNIFIDALTSLMSSNDGAQKVKKRIRISMPVVIAAFLPIKLLKDINKLVEEEPEALLLLPNQSKKQTEDLVIFIHTREGLVTGMGHVDISIDGTVYSYGNYDDSTWKFGGFFADGVLVEMDNKFHIKQALSVEKKILMAYGLSLTPEHKKAVISKLKDLQQDMVKWMPLAEQCKSGLIKGKPTDYKDTSSQLYNDSNAKFFKFKLGNPFKTYYAMGTNCVKLADQFVGKSGIDILKVNGIITPGTYLDYLDRLYERGDSIVISRTLYK